MLRAKNNSSQEEKMQDELHRLELIYKPLMEAFITLQKEASLSIDKKGYPLAFYRALENFVEGLKRLEVRSIHQENVLSKNGNKA